LSGLDQYFAGHYERAINIWTRVAFLERGHGRARAYIERARGAVAERQREAEELVQAGVEAYHAGELQTARELLTRATDAASSDTAMLFIERLRRLDASEPPRELPDARLDPPAAAAAPPPRIRVLTTIVASAAVAIVIFLVSMRVASWLSELPIDAPASASLPPEPLPIVRASELRIGEARRLFQDGKGREALHTLDAIGIADPNRSDADRLRADIQRALLGLEPR
jgi:hypothetical protein